MNAIPPRGTMPPDGSGRKGADGVRLTMDFDDEPDSGADERPDLPDDEVPPQRARHPQPPPHTWQEEDGTAQDGPRQPAQAGTRQPAQAGTRQPAQAVPPLLAGIEVTLTVEVGSLSLPLKDLMAVEPGQLFALDRMTSEPVTVLVNGRPFARGEIVAVGDRFGVRLLEIVSHAGTGGQA